MADMQTTANARADLVELFLGADRGPYEMGLDARVGYILHDYAPARVGEAIGRMIVGRLAEGEIIVGQATAAEIQKYLNTSTSAPKNNLAVGTFLPTVQMRIHDPVDGASDANDLYIFATAFEFVGLNIDGEEEKQLRIPWKGLRDANGNVWRLGPAA